MNKEKFFEELQKHFETNFKNFVFKSLRTTYFKKVFEPYALPKTVLKFTCEPLREIVSEGKKQIKLPKYFEVIVNEQFVQENHIQTNIVNHKGEYLKVIKNFQIVSSCTEKSMSSNRWTMKEYFLIKPMVFDTFESLFEIIKDTKFENY
jgi:hypothetical protein